MGAQATLDSVTASRGGPSAALFLLCDRSRWLRERFPASVTFYADPFQGTTWATPASGFLRGQPDVGLRILSDDPHVTDLAAFGHRVRHDTPTGLLSAARADPAPARRRVRVQVNGPVQDPALIGLHVAQEGGAAGFDDALLLVQGDGYESLQLSGKRMLLASLSLCAPHTVLAPWAGPVDEDPFAAERGFAPADELMIVNADLIGPLVATPGGRTVQPAGNLSLPVSQVLVGGCVGGDLETLGAALDAFEKRPPAPGVQVLLVPSCAEDVEEAKQTGLLDRAASLGTPIVSPAGIPVATGARLATNSCLAADAFLSNPSTLVASAQAGRLIAGGIP